MDVKEIESKIDRVAAGSTEVSMALGGVQIKAMSEVFDAAKMMAISGIAVPAHLRDKPGTCLAICLKALRFGFDPFALAEHSFTMVKSQKNESGQWEKVETIAYDSAVIRAIIESHANLTGVIRYSYAGEGDDRTCTAYCLPPGEKEAVAHTSPPLGQLKAARGRNSEGKIKGSPLWETKSDMQMAYDTGRDLCRKYFPGVLMGWHDRDEMDENVTPPREEKPAPRARITHKPAGRGFDADGINKTIEGTVNREEAPQDAPVADAKISPAAVAADVVVGRQGSAQALAASPENSHSVEDAHEVVSPPPEENIAKTEEISSAIPIEKNVVGPNLTAKEVDQRWKDPLTKPENVTLRRVEAAPLALPKDGGQLLAYVQQVASETTDKALLDTWSKHVRRLTNSLPNVSGEIAERCKTLIAARRAELSR